MINKDNFDIQVFHNAPVIIAEPVSLLEQRSFHLSSVANQCVISGEVLEFGVYQGTTINILANTFSNQTIYGFDSFEGLPEDWNVSFNEKYNKHKKGYFAVDVLPEVNENVKLVKGFFNASLPAWLIENPITQIKLLHVDSDLYSSAKYVLTTLNNYIIPETVIVFDEMYPWGRKRYETWIEHEYKALKEWIEEFDRSFEVISRNEHQQCAIRIVK